MNDYSYEKGIAFIVEGATERVFYEEYLKKLCSERGMTITKDEKSQENKYTICAENRSILVLINNVGSVSQMTNSATWFHRACVKEYSNIGWSVFLCYDTDAYNSDITKFHEGDWLRLRQSIESDAESIADLAAQADIEDVMLCDFQGVLAFPGWTTILRCPRGARVKSKSSNCSGDPIPPAPTMKENARGHSYKRSILTLSKTQLQYHYPSSEKPWILIDVSFGVPKLTSIDEKRQKTPYF